MGREGSLEGSPSQFKSLLSHNEMDSRTSRTMNPLSAAAANGHQMEASSPSQMQSALPDAFVQKVDWSKAGLPSSPDEGKGLPGPVQKVAIRNPLVTGATGAGGAGEESSDQATLSVLPATVVHTLSAKKTSSGKDKGAISNPLGSTSM